MTSKAPHQVWELMPVQVHFVARNKERQCTRAAKTQTYYVQLRKEKHFPIYFWRCFGFTNSIRVFFCKYPGHQSIQQVFFFLFVCLFLKFIYLFLAVLGLHFCARAFSSCGEWGATLHHGARASHHRGLSCCGAQAPDTQAQ